MTQLTTEQTEQAAKAVSTALALITMDYSLQTILDTLQTELAKVGLAIVPIGGEEPCEAALSDLLALIDEGFLVRNIKDDHKPGFSVRQLPFIIRLGKAKAISDATASSRNKEKPEKPER